MRTWIEHADRRYRLDFLVHYDGRGVAVELDGHEYHKTKEQRSYDAERDRWLKARGIRDAVFRALPVIVLPGYSRPLVRVADYLELLERSTFNGTRVR